MLSQQYRAAIQGLSKEELTKGDKVPSEASLHPILAGRGSFAFLTGHAPVFPSELQGGHQGMMQYLAQNGNRFEETNGKYGESPEPSVIAYGPTREQVMEAGRKFGQESVIYSDGGKHEFIYVNGPYAGKYHPGKPGHQFFLQEPANAYTRIPGIGHVRLDFDWDKLLDVPKKDSVVAPVEHREETMSAQKSERPITKALIKKELAMRIQRQIDKFTKEMEDLRVRELRKAEVAPSVARMAPQPNAGFAVGAPVGGLCPLCGQNDDPASCTCLDPQRDVVLKGEADRCLICGDYGLLCKCVEELHKAQCTCGKKGCMWCNPKDNAKRKNVYQGPNGMDLEHDMDDETPRKPVKKEEFIDLKNANIPGKRHKEPNGHDGKTPDDRPIKDEGGEEGSGGKITKGKLGKDEFPATNRFAIKLQGIRDNARKPKETSQVNVQSNPMAKPNFQPLGTAMKAEVPMAKPPTKAPTPSKPPASKPGVMAKAGMAMSRGAATPKADALEASRAVAAPAPAAKPAMPSQAEHSQRASMLGDFMPPGKFNSPAPAAPKIGLQRPAAAGAAPKIPGLTKGEMGNCALCKKAEHPGNCEQ